MIGILQNDNALDNLQIINEIDSIRHLIDVSNNTVANGISTINTILVAATVFIGVAGLIGIGISIYISKIEKKVSEMMKNIENKEKKISEMMENIESKEKKITELDRQIQTDIRGLYAKLRKEETLALLRRLEEEPQDVVNIDNLLVARKLDEEGFLILKKAFSKLSSNPRSETDERDLLTYLGSYCVLFFQHYLYQAILDNDIQPKIIQFLKVCMGCAFKNDIIKSTKDFCKALSTDNTSFDKLTLLTDYLKALNQSKYKNLPEIKNIFQKKIYKPLLLDAIEKCKNEGTFLVMFGIEDPKKVSKTNNKNEHNS